MLKLLSQMHRGRTPRGHFFALTLGVWFVVFLDVALIDPVFSRELVWLVDLPALFLLACLYVRRLHDLGKSGKWLLVVLVPVLGAAWLIWNLAFKRGTAESNRWGPDPLADGDHLKVDILK